MIRCFVRSVVPYGVISWGSLARRTLLLIMGLSFSLVIHRRFYTCVGLLPFRGTFAADLYSMNKNYFWNFVEASGSLVCMYLSSSRE